MVAERLRIARDMHDLFGHSLAAIAFKVELAERLLGGNQKRAAGEIAEVRDLARRSTEIQAAVAGYRRPRLAEEMARAHQGLAATAGVACDYGPPLERGPEAVAAVLAWVIPCLRRGHERAQAHRRPASRHHPHRRGRPVRRQGDVKMVDEVGEAGGGTAGA